MTIVFTNGCFDILHKGHIKYLKKSKELGDYLIVAINADQSVQKLKGKNRPINNQEDRALVLEAIKYVDKVIVFNEDTPYQLIKKIKPDIITKGGDYTEKEVVGNDIAKVVIIPYVDGYSTTGIVNAIKG
jgi:D-beta-D-heptose 7-phosphate kinase/D-beta-D-heptose 1-phosphate adenosyltransferase